MKIDEILMESVNDRGVFKALFVGGAPGSGKSYVLTKITDGTIQPRIVNTDIAYEKIAGMRGTDISSDNNKIAQDVVTQEAKILTKAKLTNYLNSMLPLFVDSTSNNQRTTSRRMRLLEEVGYDVAMVWVRTSLETALKRAEERDRHVDPEFIKELHERSEKSMAFFKSKLGNKFLIINNDEGELTDEVILAAYKKVSKFFKSDLENPIGIKQRDRLMLPNTSQKYLSPIQGSEGLEVIRDIVNRWYNV